MKDVGEVDLTFEDFKALLEQKPDGTATATVQEPEAATVKPSDTVTVNVTSCTV